MLTWSRSPAPSLVLVSSIGRITGLSRPIVIAHIRGKLEVMRDRSSADELAVLPTQLRGAPAAEIDEPGRGERIGRFEVQRVLGRGGMGVVLSARDSQLGRQVAIKLVKGGASEDFKARLLREARAMAQLRHPNIISVYEVGEHAGRIYVAMEQIEGDTLAAAIARMRRGRFFWRQVVELFIEAGRGLAAAHAAGMVHRDFKPDNVLVDTSGRVLVGDFGIVGVAGARGPRTADEQLVFSDQLTRADEVLGTPVYMAPEQHAGESVDARADQFAFCVALYEALFEQLPFAGDTRASYVESIEKGEVRPPPESTRIPGWLLVVLRRGLSAEPEHRFASMEELLLELGADADKSTRLGSAERAVLIGGFAGFVIAWTIAMLGFQIELSYKLHYMTDLGFLGLVALLGWFAREALARSELNRRSLAFVAITAVSLLVLVAGGQLSEIPPVTIGALHMLVIGSSALVAALLFGRRFVPMALCYLGGFIAAAARPELLLPILLGAHCVAAITAVAVSRAGK